MERRYDLLAMGRSSIDLYANEIGAPFTEIKSFNAYVGGCPTNIGVAANRLGLRTALLTATGEDLVGDFVLSFLAREGIATAFSPRKAGRRTSAFMLAIQPPDKFPLVPYRDNCADLELTMQDVDAAPVTQSRVLLVTGSGLSRQPSRDATLHAAERARAHGNKVVLDLDLRAELWPDPRDYGTAIRAALPLVDVVIGTADEVWAASASDVRTEDNKSLAPGAGGARADKAESNATDEGGFERLRERALTLLAIGTGASEATSALVVKRGAESTLVFPSVGEMIEAATFPVEVYNVLGAGDAFAGGFIYGYLKGWGWHKSARMGNACGAIVVTRHGCANFMPYEQETLAFIEERGGF